VQPTTPDMFNQGERGRDEGINRTLAANAPFVARALVTLDKSRFRAHYPFFTGEDLRSWLSSRGVEPNNPHAWGGLTRTLATAGQIRDTGKVKKMLDPSSHARRTPIWEWR